MADNAGEQERIAREIAVIKSRAEKNINQLRDPHTHEGLLTDLSNQVRRMREALNDRNTGAGRRIMDDLYARVHNINGVIGQLIGHARRAKPYDVQFYNELERTIDSFTQDFGASESEIEEMRNELVRLEEEQPAVGAGESGAQHPWERSEDTGDTGAKAVEGEDIKAEVAAEEGGFGLEDVFSDAVPGLSAEELAAARVHDDELRIATEKVAAGGGETETTPQPAAAAQASGTGGEPSAADILGASDAGAQPGAAAPGAGDGGRPPGGKPPEGGHQGPEQGPEFIDEQLHILETALRRGAEAIRQHDATYPAYPAWDVVSNVPHGRRRFYIGRAGGVDEPFLEVLRVIDEVRGYLQEHAGEFSHPEDRKIFEHAQNAIRELRQMRSVIANLLYTDLKKDSPTPPTPRTADAFSDEQKNALVYAIREFGLQTSRNLTEAITRINTLSKDEAEIEAKRLEAEAKRMKDPKQAARLRADVVAIREAIFQIRYTPDQHPARAAGPAALDPERGRGTGPQRGTETFMPPTTEAGPRSPERGRGRREGEPPRVEVGELREGALEEVLLRLRTLKDEHFALREADRASSKRAVEEMAALLEVDGKEVLEKVNKEMTSGRRGYAADLLLDIIDQVDPNYINATLAEAEEVLTLYLNTRAERSRLLGSSKAEEAHLTLQRDAEIQELAEVWLIRRAMVWLAAHFMVVTAQEIPDATLTEALENEDFGYSASEARRSRGIKRQNEIADAFHDATPPWEITLENVLETIIWAEEYLGHVEDGDTLLGKTAAYIEQKCLDLEEDAKKVEHKTFTMHNGTQFLDAIGRLRGFTVPGVRKTAAHERPYVRQLVEFADNFASAMGLRESLASLARAVDKEKRSKISVAAEQVVEKLTNFVVPRKMVRRLIDSGKRLHGETRQAMEAIFRREGVSQRSIVKRMLALNKKIEFDITTPDGEVVTQVTPVEADIDSRWGAATHLITHKLDHEAEQICEQFEVSKKVKYAHGKGGGHGEHEGMSDLGAQKRKAEKILKEAKIIKKIRKDPEMDHADAERLAAANYLMAAVAEDLGVITDILEKIVEATPGGKGMLDQLPVDQIDELFTQQLRPLLEQLNENQITVEQVVERMDSLFRERFRLSIPGKHRENMCRVIAGREGEREGIAERLKDLYFKTCDIADYARLFDAFSAEAYNAREAFHHQTWKTVHWRLMWKPTEVIGFVGNGVAYGTPVYGWVMKNVFDGKTFFDIPTSSPGDFGWFATLGIMVVGGSALERLAYWGRHQLHGGHGLIALALKGSAWVVEKGINMFNGTATAYEATNFGLWRRHKALEQELRRRSPMVDIGKGQIMSPEPEYIGSGPAGGPELSSGGAVAALPEHISEEDHDEWRLGPSAAEPPQARGLLGRASKALRRKPPEDGGAGPEEQ